MTMKPKYDLKMEVTIKLSEAEVGALDALAGYNHDAFIKVFYEHLGKAYMEKYEAGLREFLRTANGLGEYVRKAHAAREFLCKQESENASR